MTNAAYIKRLRGAGLRATTGRITLLKTLGKIKKPVSIEGLVKDRKLSLDQATLYRAINEFTAQGLVRQVHLGHSHAHYELATEDHHHIICTKCGYLEDIASCSVGDKIAEAVNKSKNFSQISQHSFELYGICNKCK